MILLSCMSLFFQQSHPMSIRQELQITSVEAVAFFQKTGMSCFPVLSCLRLYKNYASSPSLFTMGCLVKPQSYGKTVSIVTKVNSWPTLILNRKTSTSYICKLVRLLNYPCVVFWWSSLGPPTVPPQLFDMNPRPQGIVIREPVEEEDYLDHSSPDTVLFKTPETVMLELGEQTVSSDEIMAEQCAIEADLLAQKLKDAANTLAQASNSVPETFKIGNSQASEERPMTTDSPQVNEPEAKSKSRKRHGSARKENANKKQSIDAKKVEAASLKWLPNDK
ncbi:hypothetical protein LINGRAHAP2_LOCUS31903 [Linum grandiflorum]